MKTKLFPQQILFIQKKQGSETLESNKKRTYFDLEKIVSCAKSWKKSSHALLRVDMRALHVKQKINFTWSKTVQIENIVKKELFPYCTTCLQREKRATKVDNKRTRTARNKRKVNKVSAIALLCSIT